MTVQDDLSQRSEVDNVEENMTPRSNYEEDQCFSRSLVKISQVNCRRDANKIK